ncbi:hypothetical protein [Thiomicrospira sp.]|uniref:hypothetical protein n=1 Tax=Thiomicrospira sp. TaxID=935 RepID=UPI002F952877
MGFNKFFFNGEIVDVDLRDSGNAMVWVKTSNHPEVEINHSQIPSWYTSIIPVRISKKTLDGIIENRKKSNNAKKNSGDSSVLNAFEIGAIYNIEGSIQGIKRIVDGKPFYSSEIQAARIFKDDE